MFDGFVVAEGPFGDKYSEMGKNGIAEQWPFLEAFVYRVFRSITRYLVNFEVR